MEATLDTSSRALESPVMTGGWTSVEVRGDARKDVERQPGARNVWSLCGPASLRDRGVRLVYTTSSSVPARSRSR